MMCLLHSCMIPLHCFLLSNSLIPQYVLYSLTFYCAPRSAAVTCWSPVLWMKAVNGGNRVCQQQVLTFGLGDKPHRGSNKDWLF